MKYVCLFHLGLVSMGLYAMEVLEVNKYQIQGLGRVAPVPYGDGRPWSPLWPANIPISYVLTSG